jgi:valyl-tRNA synthetase
MRRCLSTWNRVALPREKMAPMAAAFEPAAVEGHWYDWWHTHARVFDPTSRPDRPSTSLILPPPNVTGALHIGHALTVAAEDALVRWRRMAGDNVLWVPGLDHAGIATQSVVERRLLKEEGKSRHDLGRDAFLAKVWEWKDLYGGRITGQVQRLGASLDWSREFFTLDHPRARAVVVAFRSLFNDGLLYRANRLVNWCPHLKTALSDIEVDVLQLDGPTSVTLPRSSSSPREVELGWIETFAYPLADVPGQALHVATTRLETMLADVAVAVHPDDPRYSHLIGKNVVHPISGRQLPVIADAQLVDVETGTGVVKITPAHDPHDWECGVRHNLPAYSMLDEFGRVCRAESVGAGPRLPDDGALVPTALVGVDRFEARERVRGMLKDRGVYVKREPRAMAVAVCSRSGDVLEPMVRPQWWVSAESLAARSLRDMTDGSTEFVPASSRNEWRRWLEASRDWCISRQLWWGHRVPAWRVIRTPTGSAASVTVDPSPDSATGSSPTLVCPSWQVFEGEEWVVANSEDEALRIARGASASDAARAHATERGVRVHPDDHIRVVQDEDVLDTWFSSGLLPLAALGWPSGGGRHGVDKELEHFYPLTVMETGMDILFFWVARMSMLCSHMGERAAPFHQVFLHGLVRDREGRKMSKSLGNVIDPLAVMDGRTLEELTQELWSGNIPPSEAKRAEQVLKREFPKGFPPSGADALRGALAHMMQGQGQDVNMDVRRVHGWRLFANKLWNASRFIISHVDAALPHTAGRAGAPSLGVAQLPLAHGAELPLVSRWVLSRFAQATVDVNVGLATFDIGAAASAVHQFVQAELCDVALEWAKPRLHSLQVDFSTGSSSAVEVDEETLLVAASLAYVLDGTLRLMHPLMPFVTEELWQRLHRLGVGTTPREAPHLPPSVALAPFPGSPGPLKQGLRVEDLRSPTRDAWWRRGSGTDELFRWLDPAAEADMAKLTSVVSAARAIFAILRSAGVSHRDVPLIVSCEEPALVEQYEHELRALLRVDDLRVELHQEAAPGRFQQAACPGIWVGAELATTLGDTADRVRQEVERLRSRASKRLDRVAATVKRTKSPGFPKAPLSVQQDAWDEIRREQSAAEADMATATALEHALNG